MGIDLFLNRFFFFRNILYKAKFPITLKNSNMKLFMGELSHRPVHAANIHIFPLTILQFSCNIVGISRSAGYQDDGVFWLTWTSQVAHVRVAVVESSQSS